MFKDGLNMTVENNTIGVTRQNQEEKGCGIILKKIPCKTDGVEQVGQPVNVTKCV